MEAREVLAASTPLMTQKKAHAAGVSIVVERQETLPPCNCGFDVAVEFGESEPHHVQGCPRYRQPQLPPWECGVNGEACIGPDCPYAFRHEVVYPESQLKTCPDTKCNHPGACNWPHCTDLGDAKERAATSDSPSQLDGPRSTQQSVTEGTEPSFCTCSHGVQHRTVVDVCEVCREVGREDLRSENEHLEQCLLAQRLDNGKLRAENERLRAVLEQISKHRDLVGPTAAAYMASEVLKND